MDDGRTPQRHGGAEMHKELRVTLSLSALVANNKKIELEKLLSTNY